MPTNGRLKPSSTFSMSVCGPALMGLLLLQLFWNVLLDMIQRSAIDGTFIYALTIIVPLLLMYIGFT